MSFGCGGGGGEEDEAAGRVRKGLARKTCRGFPLVFYINEFRVLSVSCLE